MANNPYFLVIGAEKSGTTWLKHNMIDHPQIFIPREKELHFFDRDSNFEKGLTWYLDHFLGADNEQVCGEITPGYLTNSEVSSQRIKSLFPEVKLIALIRNPIDRAWSNYKMNLHKGDIYISFSEVIKKDHLIIRKGKYRDRLRPFLDSFDHEQLLILNYELLKNDPETLLRNIFSFLKVDKAYRSTRINEVIFKSRDGANPGLNNLVSRAAKLMRKIGLAGIVQTHKSGIKRWLEKHGPKGKVQTKMNHRDKARLLKYYQEDIEFLEDYWGEKLSHWRQ